MIYGKEYMRSKKIKSNRTWHHSDSLNTGSRGLSQFVDKDGDVWHTDEYGDRSYMWDYR